MGIKRAVSLEEALLIGTQLGINWQKVDAEEFRCGLEVELEHGTHDPATTVTRNDLILVARIVWSHLKDIRDYYAWLKRCASAKTFGDADVRRLYSDI